MPSVGAGTGEAVQSGRSGYEKSQITWVCHEEDGKRYGLNRTLGYANRRRKELEKRHKDKTKRF